MFKTNFSEHNKIWVVMAELSPESLPLWAFMFVQGG